MQKRIMERNFAKVFKTLIILAVILAVLTAAAVPLSLSQQISDIAGCRQQELLDGAHDGDDEYEYESRITPLSAASWAVIGCLGVLWAVLALIYWLEVPAWLYKSAVNEGMNRSLWPILGLFFNIFAVFAFLIARDRPSRSV